MTTRPITHIMTASGGLTVRRPLAIFEADPVPLPSYTMRVRYAEGTTPSPSKSATVTRYSEPNVFDIYRQDADWSSMFETDRNLLEVIGFNSTGITEMHHIFYSCSNLTAVVLFDTSAVENMERIFEYCTSLTYIPLLDTSSATDVTSICEGCVNVESGALALYQQASTQAIRPIYYGDAFTNCGVNTVTGAAELAQIPSSWGGLA